MNFFKKWRKPFKKIEHKSLWQVTIPTCIGDIEDFVIARNEGEVSAFVALKYPGRSVDSKSKSAGYGIKIKRLSFFGDTIYITH